MLGRFGNQLHWKSVDVGRDLGTYKSMILKFCSIFICCAIKFIFVYTMSKTICIMNHAYH